MAGNSAAVAAATLLDPVLDGGAPPELLSFPATIAFQDGELTLRRLQDDDAEALIRFALSLPPDDLLFLRRDITHRAEVDDWIAEAMSGYAPTILACSREQAASERVIGYVLLAAERVRWARHVAEVRLMVAPRWRGRGLGGVLLSQAVALGRESGFRKLIAQMTFDQAEALTAFTRFGFEHEATLPDRVIDRDGELRALRVMGLTIERYHARESPLAEAARGSAARLFRWNGRAELLDANGLVVAEVEAELWKEHVEGRGERWGGELTATPVSDEATGMRWEPSEAPPELRLANGRSGAIGALGTVRLDGGGTGARQVVQLTGQAEPPF
jgi:L-amino acid N-acyltransferase YncA